MIIAITGGSGFVGKSLVDKCLELGHKVRILTRTFSNDRKNVKYFLGDLSCQDHDFSSFVEGVDILYHCAGEINNDSLMEELHVDGTKRLVEAATGKISCWVQLSSVGVYGVCRFGKVNESSIEQPYGVYESTKNESDNIVKASSIPHVVLRPSNIFGDDMPNKSLWGLIEAIKSGMFFYIGKKNEAVVNYVHVSDVVNALILCGSDKNALGEVFILSQSLVLEDMIISLASGNDSNKKILRFPEALIRFMVLIFGWIPRFPLTNSRVDALTGKCVYNSTKILKMLGFSYSMSLEEGLRLFAKQK